MSTLHKKLPEVISLIAEVDTIIIDRPSKFKYNSQTNNLQNKLIHDEKEIQNISKRNKYVYI